MLTARPPGDAVRVVGRWDLGLMTLSRSIRQGEGDVLWCADRHGLAFPLTEQGRVEIRDEGARVIKGPFGPDHLFLRPGGTGMRARHGPGPKLQLLVDHGIFVALGLETRRGHALEFALGPPLEDRLMVEAVRALAGELEGGWPVSRLLVDSLVAIVAVRLARHSVGGVLAPSPAAALAPQRLRRVLDHIEAHLAEELSLERLAQVACLSPAHFSRAFKAAVGQGPHAYVTARRIGRAKALLRPGGPTLAEVAAATGFADQPHFTTVFRRQTGATPGRYRDALR